MDPILKFTVNNQRIYRDDNFHVVSGSKNYLTASFLFLTPEWEGKTKTAIFYDGEKPHPVILVNDACEVPWEFTAESGEKYVSVFAGDLITANKALVMVWESGYAEGETPNPPTPTVYEQIIALLESKADGLSYSGNILKLLSGENEIARVTITGGGGGGREIEFRKSESAIQWRYTGDTEWIDLVPLADITGPSGPAGQDGQDGKDGLPGADGITPIIGENGNWYLGDTDTGKPSRGETGPAGQDGAQGPKGDTGADGKSAYQYAQEGGYTGTEDEFKEKLAQEKFANPNALTFTGAVTGSYDGSEPLAVNIPSSGGGSGGTGGLSQLATVTLTEPAASIVLNFTEVEDIIISAQFVGGMDESTATTIKFNVNYSGSGAGFNHKETVNLSSSAVGYYIGYLYSRSLKMRGVLYAQKNINIAGNTTTLRFDTDKENIFSIRVFTDSATPFGIGTTITVYGGKL